MEAVRTCAALLVPNLLPPTIFTTPFIQFSAASAQVVGDVLGKLLTVGITDQGGTLAGTLFKCSVVLFKVGVRAGMLCLQTPL